MDDRTLRKQVLELLRGEDAHPKFEEAVADFPRALRGRKPRSVGRTAWQLLEHMRIAQWDILEFIRNSEHTSPPWPEGYWPESPAPPDASAWEKSARAFLRDRGQLERMVRERDLLAGVPEEKGPTLLHEIFLVAAHNSYHLGQLLLIRRSLGA